MEHMMPSSQAFSNVPMPSSHAVIVQPTDNQHMLMQEDTKLWQQLHYNQPPQPQQTITQLSEDHAVLVPSRTEQLPRDIQQSMLTTLHVPVNGSTMVHRPSEPAQLPAPVVDIYQRLTEKQQQVTSMSGNSEDVSQLLSSVQKGEKI